MKLKITFLITLLCILVTHFSSAQNKTVTGTVTAEADGMPLIGVSVVVKGTSRGVQTDFDGNYNISVSQGEILVFSYVGLVPQEVTVGASNTYNVTMQDDVATLDEVIVTAYGTSTKEAFTGSASVIGEEELVIRNVTSPIAAIEGNATGVQFTSANGQPGSSPGIIIRV